MKTKLARLATIKEEMRTMLDAAAAEKRSLTPDEQTKFDALGSEKGALAVELELQKMKNEKTETRSADRKATFIGAVCDIVQKRSLEAYGGNIEQNAIIISERASGDLITDSADAAAMVPVTIGEIIEPLEKGLILDKMGVKMQTGLVGELTFPTLAAIEATIEGENTQLNDTELNIGSIKSNPKRVAITVPVSNRAITQTNYSLQNVVLKQISLAVARTLNKWMFSDTLLSGASKGVFVKDAPNVEYATTPLYADIVALETAVTDKGVDVSDGTAGYVCSPKMYGVLKTTPIDAGSGRMVLENGMMNGYPVSMTNYMVADAVGFGVFSNAGLGQFGTMRLVVDPYTGAKKDITNFTLNADYDIVIARPEAFAVAKKKAGK